MEIKRGWVEHVCDAHGFLVATTPHAHVTCPCGKVARIVRNGRVVDEETLKPTRAKPRALNAQGQPYLHRCGDCGTDFGGKEILSRHRVGRREKRCLSAEEMHGRGWRLNARGRWSREAPTPHRTQAQNRPI
jgi:hypothetical protein